MNANLVFQEIAITLAAKNYNPAFFTPEFLTASGIIPHDWEINKQPIFTQNLVQLSFKQGINLTAQPGKVTFSETIGTKKIEQMLAPKIAIEFAEKLPNSDYISLAIGIRSLHSMEQSEDTVRQHIVENLLNPTAWTADGQTPVQASINLIYELERCSLALNVSEARWQQGENKPVPALLVDGGFNYNLGQIESQQRLVYMNELLENWHRDLETYREIVTGKVCQGAFKTLHSGSIADLETVEEISEKVEPALVGAS
jgi:hypothetical protein